MAPRLALTSRRNSIGPTGLPKAKVTPLSNASDNVRSDPRSLSRAIGTRALERDLRIRCVSRRPSSSRKLQVRKTPSNFSRLMASTASGELERHRGAVPISRSMVFIWRRKVPSLSTTKIFGFCNTGNYPL